MEIQWQKTRHLKTQYSAVWLDPPERPSWWDLIEQVLKTRITAEQTDSTSTQNKLIEYLLLKNSKEKVTSSLLFPALGEKKKKENEKILMSLYTIHFLGPKWKTFILTVITSDSELVNNFVDCCSVSELFLYTCLLY